MLQLNCTQSNIEIFSKGSQKRFKIGGFRLDHERVKTRAPQLLHLILRNFDKYQSNTSSSHKAT